MNVEQILIEELEPGSMPGLAAQIHVVGSGFANRAAPFFARFGAQSVQDILIAPGGAGFSGFLANTPAPEDRLFVHYADEPEVEPGAEPGPPILA
jgi:hypothetical protein